MDRLQFSGSIDIDPVAQVKNFFDEVMAMYNLIVGFNYNYIRGIINDDDSISFSVEFSSNQFALEAANIISSDLGVSVIYGKMFEISATSESDTELSLHFKKIR